jgi:protein-tyrosine phosphatase
MAAGIGKARYDRKGDLGHIGNRMMSSKEYQLAGIDTASPPVSGYWVVPNLLLAGPFPGDADPSEHQEKLQKILDAGIRTFVNLMHEDEIDHEGRLFAPYKDLIQRLRPDAIFVRYPIVDLSVPTVDEMTAILNAIDRSLEENKPVYVHCWGGVGRTGTVVGCWMLRHGLATPENYLDVLATLRRQDRQRGQRMSPETGEQQRFVKEWFSSVKQG